MGLLFIDSFQQRIASVTKLSKLIKSSCWICFQEEPFEYPKIFGPERKTDEKQTEKTYMQAMEQRQQEETKNWTKTEIPPWFR